MSTAGAPATAVLLTMRHGACVAVMSHIFAHSLSIIVWLSLVVTT